MVAKCNSHLRTYVSSLRCKRMIQKCPALVSFNGASNAGSIHETEHVLRGTVSSQSCELMVPSVCSLKVSWMREVAMEAHFRQEEHSVGILRLRCAFQKSDSSR